MNKIFSNTSSKTESLKTPPIQVRHGASFKIGYGRYLIEHCLGIQPTLCFCNDKNPLMTSTSKIHRPGIWIHRLKIFSILWDETH